MKTNCWLMVGVMLATSAIAQNNPNPGAAAPAATPPPAEAAPATAPAEAPKPVKHKHHTAAKVAPLSEPTVNLSPGPAQVVTKTLTARGQAGLRGEVVAHLKQGDTVTVISQINLEKHRANEPAQWAQIAFPSGTHVWVFA